MSKRDYSWGSSIKGSMMYTDIYLDYRPPFLTTFNPTLNKAIIFRLVWEEISRAVGVFRLISDALRLLPIRRRGTPIVSFYKWPMFFNVLSVMHWYTERTSTYLHLVILVGVRGERTRNPWIDSQVFYHCTNPLA